MNKNNDKNVQSEDDVHKDITGGGEEFRCMDHSHCWNQIAPACGQKIKHFECCLCKTPHPDVLSNTKVEMLRQWLNEDRITDSNKMVTNDHITYWLKV